MVSDRVIKRPYKINGSYAVGVPLTWARMLQFNAAAPLALDFDGQRIVITPLNGGQTNAQESPSSNPAGDARTS